MHATSPQVCDSNAAAAANSPVVGYAPSPTTGALAVERARQLRVHALTWRLVDSKLSVDERLAAVKLLANELRKQHFQLTWLNQLDLICCCERAMREFSSINSSSNSNNNNNNATTASNNVRRWQVVSACTQLLAEAVLRLPFEIEVESLRKLMAIVIPSLGSTHGELRRASLVFVNLFINEKPAFFQQTLQLLIEFGLSAQVSKATQKGAVLALPLLLTRELIIHEDLSTLIESLALLLVSSDSSLFYSVFLALQRLELTMGERKFNAYMRRCGREPMRLYAQTASRHNSLVASDATIVDSHIGLPVQERQQQRHSTSATSSSSSPSQQQLQQPQSPQLPPPSADAQQQQQQQQHQSPTKTVSFERTNNNAESNFESKTVNSDESESCSDEPVTVVHHSKRANNFSNHDDDDDKRDNFIKDDDVDSALSADSEDATHTPQVRTEKLSSVSSTSSSLAHLVKPTHYMPRSALVSTSTDALTAHFDAVHKHASHAHQTLGMAINSYSGNAHSTPTIEFGPSVMSGTELKFGVFARHVAQAALSARTASARLEALNEMMCVVRESPINHLAILMTYFDAFLEQFVDRLVRLTPTTTTSNATTASNAATISSNECAQIKLVALEMLETIVVKTKAATLQFVRPIVGLLIKALVNSNISNNNNAMNEGAAVLMQKASAQQMLIRHLQSLTAPVGGFTAATRNAVSRVVHKLMSYLPPQHVVDALLEFKHHNARSVREQVCARVTFGVLEFDKREFNSTKLCYNILPLLADKAPSVRLAALECIACLAFALGPQRIGSLLTAADAVQTGCSLHGLLDAINVRLTRRALPKVVSRIDGTLRYGLTSALNKYAHELRQGLIFELRELPADVRWIVDAAMHSSAANAASDSRALSQQRSNSNNSINSNSSSINNNDDDDEQDENNAAVASKRKKSLSSSSPPQSSPMLLPRVDKGHKSDSEIDDASSIINNLQPTSAGTSFTSSAPTTAAAANHAHKSSLSSTTLNAKSNAVNHVVSDERQKNSENNNNNNSNSNNINAEHKHRRNNSNKHSNSSSGGSSRRNSRQHQQQQQQQQNKRRIQSDENFYNSSTATATNRQSQESTDCESNASSDANKLLFRYYLDKFRQSLSDDCNELFTAATNNESIVSSGSSREKKRSKKNCNKRKSAAATLLPSDSELCLASADDKLQLQFNAAGKQCKQQQTRASPTTDVDDSSSEPQVASKQRCNNERQAAVTRRRSTPNFKELRRQSNVERPATTTSNNNNTDFRATKMATDTQQAPNTATTTTSTTTNAKDAAASDEDDDDNNNKNSNYAEASDNEIKQHSASNKQTNQFEPKTDSHVESKRRQSVTSVDSATSSTTHARNDNDARQLSAANSSASATTGSSSAAVAWLPQSQSQSQFESQSTSGAIAAAAERGRHRRKQSPPETSEQQLQRRRSRVSAARSQPAVSHATRANAAASMQTHHSKANYNLANKQHLSTQSALLGANGLAGESMRRAMSVSPSLAAHVNIREILENVARVDGPFADAQLALRVTVDALAGPCWSTKVEGLLAVIRLANFSADVLAKQLHEVVSRVALETRNLRSTVARSAVFALGELCAKLQRRTEPELDVIIQALMLKSSESSAFIRDDINRALTIITDSKSQLSPNKLLQALLRFGIASKNVNVRRMAAEFVARLVDRLGAVKLLAGSRSCGAELVPAIAEMAQDKSPHTRYYGRVCLGKLAAHHSFEKLMRAHLPPPQFRAVRNVLEFVRRRGPGTLPAD